MRECALFANDPNVSPCPVWKLDNNRCFDFGHQPKVSPPYIFIYIVFNTHGKKEQRIEGKKFVFRWFIRLHNAILNGDSAIHTATRPHEGIEYIGYAGVWVVILASVRLRWVSVYIEEHKAMHETTDCTIVAWANGRSKIHRYHILVPRTNNIFLCVWLMYGFSVFFNVSSLRSVWRWQGRKRFIKL